MCADEKKPLSRSWRLFSLETLLALVGLSLLAAGLFKGHLIQIFWGMMTLCGLLVLHKMRKKDWQAHWDEKNRHMPAKKNDHGGDD